MPYRMPPQRRRRSRPCLGSPKPTPPAMRLPPRAHAAAADARRRCALPSRLWPHAQKAEEAVRSMYCVERPYGHVISRTPHDSLTLPPHVFLSSSGDWVHVDQEEEHVVHTAVQKQLHRMVPTAKPTALGPHVSLRPSRKLLAHSESAHGSVTVCLDYGMN